MLHELTTDSEAQDFGAVIFIHNCNFPCLCLLLADYVPVFFFSQIGFGYDHALIPIETVFWDDVPQEINMMLGPWEQFIPKYLGLSSDKLCEYIKTVNQDINKIRQDVSV